MLFSENQDDLNMNIFKREINKIDTEKCFGIFKFIVGHYLISFLSNDGNNKFLEINKIDINEFENEIFNIFEYQKEDIKKYRKLFNLFIEKNDFSKYFLLLYAYITENVFGKEDENVVAGIYFSKILSSSYQSFLGGLTEELN